MTVATVTETTPTTPPAAHLCEMCATPVVQKRRGRPRLYCSDKCGELANLLQRLETALDGADLGAESSKAMRSRLWYLANLLNAGQRTVQA